MMRHEARQVRPSVPSLLRLPSLRFALDSLEPHFGVRQREERRGIGLDVLGGLGLCWSHPPVRVWTVCPDGVGASGSRGITLLLLLYFDAALPDRGVGEGC